MTDNAVSENNDRMPRMVRSHDVTLDAEYANWIREIKRRYRGAQVKAAVKVNSEQLLFNWELGRDLVIRKAEERWGSGVVEQMSLDLQSEFPHAKGFSTRNLWYMKRWYQFYAIDKMQEKLQRLYEEIASTAPAQLRQVASAYDADILHQSGAETGAVSFPQVFAYVPWRHHVEIITHCKSVEEAVFYLARTIQENWSRSALQNAIKADLFHTTGNAMTNFGELLPAAQGKLAQAITKDTYDLGFIALPPEYDEHDLEVALEQNITRFLLELGTGFAFMGRQKEIIVSGKTRKIDMLFYHIHLRCYVVVELKTRAFEPEFAGKLNFYVNAVDELMKTSTDNPTLGLLICREKDRTEVQWAFRGIDTPMGVATYGNVRIEDIQKHLPSDDQIRQQVETAEREFIKDLDENSTSER
ncbi:PDDEXK nuclease domain-containing protein [Adlercreutzia sp. ZJ141]|uniref:PDDEXK nuclease domain-containing protein n=1 Tax=Adlercreutzia sp. ZJ141 TaxID=2709406 RepID=UPI00197F4F53|nr:PDDEXK nuclease domain-containing protein [Adlercreutzia sp. ZJ141]